MRLWIETIGSRGRSKARPSTTTCKLGDSLRRPSSVLATLTHQANQAGPAILSHPALRRTKGNACLFGNGAKCSLLLKVRPQQAVAAQGEFASLLRKLS